MNHVVNSASAIEVRAIAAETIAAVFEGRQSLSAVLPLAQRRVSTGDRALLAELCYGSLRFFHELSAITQLLMEKPLPAKNADVQGLLLIGLYQLRHTRVADHAAVNLCVAACNVLGKSWAGKLVNAVLRNYQRRQTEVDAHVAAIATAHHSHPRWLVESIQQAWPAQAEAVFAANNCHAGMSLRVNALQYSAADYAAQLAQVGIGAQLVEEAPQALQLDKPVPVENLPAFFSGACSVQDIAAQLCAPLLQLAPGQRVLDACCAPGGKTGHMLESEPALAHLVAIDNDENRLQRVRDNLARLQLSATVLCADAGDPASWYDGKPFDRILLDAPCSGTGVIRRHPDIKLLRRAGDIAALAQRQRALLEALWPLLAPGGVLLYTTCSILPEENEQLVTGFIAEHADAAVLAIDVDWGIAQPCGVQLLPGEFSDGFYFARIQKK